MPIDFVHPLFFQEGEMIEKQEEIPFPHALKTVYFYYDIVDSAYVPWEKAEQTIPALLKLWNEEKAQLQVLFAEKRNRTLVQKPMVRGLSYFIMLLFWMNQSKVTQLRMWQKAVEALPLKPMNCMERLQFIFQRCDTYPSFVQLNELFEEAAKLFYKKLAIVKKRMPSC
ncbi:hypothetical protein GFC29_1440 [Anoxybacillus sp. B7M1]|uniref:YpoC family protein n=1 Tax=unclassified Anoxybacillus TaxID=2639704 RepID=UPI0007B5ADCC|nr:MULTISPECIES: hypothetical protein [unclassified Anoxybacillus]ANB58170.1 hypothetical protein GFC28_185 [Anoxybacillus sp. B2M1]ANB64652.1 hypothetical protein GFC29_1440 [Anoxybacillus sp. B7M1]